MATKNAVPAARLRPLKTTIVGKFQITVPLEIREMFDLQEGDVFEWNFDEDTGRISLLPMRPQLLTPRVKRALDWAAEDYLRNTAKDESAPAPEKTAY